MRSARMDMKKSLAVILLVFLIVSKPSDASVIGNIRRMVGLSSEGKPNVTQISPSPSPIPVGRSDVSGKSGVKTPPDPPVPDNSKKEKPSNSGNKASEQPQTEKKEDKNSIQEENDEKCPLMSKRCTGQYKMVACLQHYKSGSQGLFILVRNEGESTLKVTATAASATLSPKELEISKHQPGKINVSVNVGESAEIVLNAGNGDCMIQIGIPTSESKISQWIPSYVNQLTPIYGAYLMFLMVLIVGGTWACCKFGKGRRRTDGGIPYQELEMGLPGSGSTTNVETADGWDQGWDDNWDEEGAIKSPGGQHAGNVSANGLTSRSPNREGWENGWDE